MLIKVRVLLTWAKSPACSASQISDGSAEDGDVSEEGEIAEASAPPAPSTQKAKKAMAATPAVDGKSAGRGPAAAADKRTATKTAPAAKLPMQFTMPDMQRSRPQQNPDKEVLQRKPLSAFADELASEHNSFSTTGVADPDASIEHSAARERVTSLSEPKQESTKRFSQHDISQSMSQAEFSRQRDLERRKGRSHGRMQREVSHSIEHAKSGLHRSERARPERERSRDAAQCRRRTRSPHWRSNAERRPSSSSTQQNSQSGADQFAPMVSDILQQLSSISLLSIRKCVTGHLFSVLT